MEAAHHPGAPYPVKTPERSLPAYRLPRDVLLGITRDLIRAQPRSLLADARALIAGLPNPPAIAGLEHIPALGGAVVVYNHYERPGLWIGFAGALLIDGVARARKDESAVPLHMVVTDRARVGLGPWRFDLPASRFFLKRVARMWGMVPMSADAADAMQRGQALKQVLVLVRRGRVVALAPEGAGRGDQGLRPALVGTGAFLARLSRNGVPIQPVGVWEEGPRLRVHWGEPFRIVAEEDATARAELMARIAGQLPEGMR